MLEIVILSITQGISEFLPVSSSAHLILVSKYLKFNQNNLTLDVSLHFGSLLGIILFFKNDILNFIKNKSLFIKIIISSLPTMILGFLLVKFNLIEQLRNIKVISITTILFGVLIFFSDKSETKKNISNNFNIKDAFYIGLMQTLSLIPGVSRSGITITTARFLKFERVEAAKISFLLSIPTLLGVSIYGIIKIIETGNVQFTKHNLLAIILSFIFSSLTIKFFIRFLQKFKLTIFVLYRIFLGLVILFYVYN